MQKKLISVLFLILIILSISGISPSLQHIPHISTTKNDTISDSVYNDPTAVNPGELQHVSLNYYYHDSIYNYLYIEADKCIIEVGAGRNRDVAPTVKDTLWRLLTNIYANNLTEDIDIAKTKAKTKNKETDCHLLMIFAPKNGRKKVSSIALERYNDHSISKLHPDIIRTIGLMHVNCSENYINTAPSEFCDIIAPYAVKDFHTLGISNRAPSLTSIGVDSIRVSLQSNMKSYDATLCADKSYAQIYYIYNRPKNKTVMAREVRDTLLTLVNQMFVAKTVSPISNVKRVDDEIVIDGPVESVIITLYHNGSRKKVRQSIGWIDEQTVSTPSPEMQSLINFLKSGCDTLLLTH